MFASPYQPTANVGEGEEYELGAPEGPPLYDLTVDAGIIAWRVECLDRLGLEALHVNALAVRRDVDLDHVQRLVKDGCPLNLVGAIVL